MVLLKYPWHWFPSREQLQHRRREAKQTERALWHWSLTLQAKVTLACTDVSHCNIEHWIGEFVLTRFSMVCESAAGVVWLEAAGHRAAQETRAGGQRCSGLQGPAAEGGRDMHPHVCCSHERSHNELNAAQPRAGSLSFCLVRRSNWVLFHQVCLCPAEVTTSPESGEAVCDAVEAAGAVWTSKRARGQRAFAQKERDLRFGDMWIGECVPVWLRGAGSWIWNP